VGYEKIGGIPWIEIDFPEDIDRASLEILPAMRELENNATTTPVTR
jgi:choline kinase